MPSRTIKRNLTKGHVEIIGNIRTEGHGLMFHNNQENPIENDVAIPPHVINPTKLKSHENTDINKFFLKIHPRSYISFD